MIAALIFFLCVALAGVGGEGGDTVETNWLDMQGGNLVISFPGPRGPDMSIIPIEQVPVFDPLGYEDSISLKKKYPVETCDVVYNDMHLHVLCLFEILQNGGTHYGKKREPWDEVTATTIWISLDSFVSSPAFTKAVLERAQKDWPKTDEAQKAFDIIFKT